MLNLTGGSEQKQDLQFDRVSQPGSGAVSGSASCTACHTHIADVYYDVNGHTFCEKCRVLALNAAETPGGIGPLLLAGLFGFGGAIAGAVVYYAVLAMGFEIGIIAILCGYLVGYMVRKGAGTRGGRRFQVMAVLLTYLSIAMAWAPIFVKEIRAGNTQESAVAGKAAGGTTTVSSEKPADAKEVTTSGLVRAVGVLLGLFIALPLIAAFGSMPSGLISLVIMFFGMARAWRMTAAPQFVVSGPYRVGGGATSPAV
jgi:hypothetical protein